MGGWVFQLGNPNLPQKTHVVHQLKYLSELISLKLTASSHLKMDGWKTFAFPFGKPYLQVLLLLVSVGVTFRCFSPSTFRTLPFEPPQGLLKTPPQAPLRALCAPRTCLARHSGHATTAVCQRPADLGIIDHECPGSIDTDTLGRDAG